MPRQHRAGRPVSDIARLTNERPTVYRDLRSMTSWGPDLPAGRGRYGIEKKFFLPLLT
jgi:hypothetical protein